mmetsp:Transcript_13650/g.19948  ORF Transcript_13650/g.19948 Transcript_13650/m.19948 type:complete len:327 (+) Transcript_13650:709-1689(+)
MKKNPQKIPQSRFSMYSDNQLKLGKNQSCHPRLQSLRKQESDMSQETSEEEYYWTQVHYFSSKRNLRMTISHTEKLKELYSQKEKQTSLENVHGFEGDYYLEMNQIRQAIRAYNTLKNLADQNKSYKNKMYAYRQIGHCYKLMKQYRLALVNYKKLLQLAWDQNNVTYELLAYDMIGMQYFYLGELEKAKYYHDRMWTGITEDKNSAVRELALRNLKAKRERKSFNIYRSNISAYQRDIFGVGAYLSSDDETELPSPRSSSGTTDQRFLPHFSSKVHQLKKSRSVSKITSSRISEGARPFVLLSHLSTTVDLRNFDIIDQMDVSSR